MDGGIYFEVERVVDIPVIFGCYAFIHPKITIVLSNRFRFISILFHIHDSSFILLRVVLKTTKYTVSPRHT